MKIERTGTGVVLFPEVMGTIRHRYRGLQKAHELVLEGAQETYLKQKKEGLFPFDLSVEEIGELIKANPRFGESGTIVKWSGEGESRHLVARTYRKSSYRRIFDEKTLKGLSRIASIGRVYHNESMSEEAEILKESFVSGGDPDRAQHDYTNMRKHPDIGVLTCLLDRYLHPYGMTNDAWSYVQKPELSREFTMWSRNILYRLGKNPIVDFIFCDCAGQAGYPSERIWQANALPSQPHIAEKVGHLIFFFDNVAEWKTEEYVQPLFKRITPGYLLREWQSCLTESIAQTRRVVVAAHEVGHAAHTIPEGAKDRLGDMYQNLREVFADSFSLFAILNYFQEGVITKDIADVAIYFDLARSISIIERYSCQPDDINGKIGRSKIDPYAFSAAIKLNRLLNSGVVSRASNGFYWVEDKNRLRDEVISYNNELQRLTNEASRNNVEDYLLTKSVTPEDFFHQAA